MFGSRMVAGGQVYSLYSLSALNYIIYILQEDGQTCLFMNLCCPCDLLADALCAWWYLEPAKDQTTDCHHTCGSHCVCRFPSRPPI
jgi:hypothetical protein